MRPGASSEAGQGGQAAGEEGQSEHRHEPRQPEPLPAPRRGAGLARRSAGGTSRERATSARAVAEAAARSRRPAALGVRRRPERAEGPARAQAQQRHADRHRGEVVELLHAEEPDQENLVGGAWRPTAAQPPPSAAARSWAVTGARSASARTRPGAGCGSAPRPRRPCRPGADSGRRTCSPPE